MRNSRYRAVIRLGFLTLMSLAVGCASNDAAKNELNAGYSALEQSQFDSAIADADAVLQRNPTGPGTAEALYLKGRALEQRPASSPQQAQTNLQAARDAYIDALTRQPAPKLEAFIHTSLGNVAYFQDDYSTASSEWTTAYDKLDDKDIKAWTLYRVGVSRQRLGQFTDADQIFQMVQQQYPDTIPAQRAKEHQGVHSFTIQFATFSTAQQADSAIAALRRDGVMATRRSDPKGRSVVIAESMPTYQQAMSVRARFLGTYRDALILP